MITDYIRYKAWDCLISVYAVGIKKGCLRSPDLINRQN
jgi:hypothetical protein